MNGWRGVLGVLILFNVSGLVWNLWGVQAVGRVVEVPGLRAEWVAVEQPWKQAVEVVLSPAPLVPKINLKEGQAQLELAIQEASKQVLQDPKNNQKCRVWGPLLKSESTRVQEALSNWGGQVDQLEQQVPVGYVVYLPREVVDSGQGIEKLTGKGISNMFYISTPGPLQGTISLGLYREIERANLQKEDLIRRGVQGVQIRKRLGPVRVFFELRGNKGQMESLESIFNLNRKGELNNCS
jgi:hypothetical protein